MFSLDAMPSLSRFPQLLLPLAAAALLGACAALTSPAAGSGKPGADSAVSPSAQQQALNQQNRRQATAELKALSATTGLSDSQLARLRAAEATLRRGDSSTALAQLRALRKEATGRNRVYTVRPGETLSEIAEREEVYGNALLWPLIWQANRKTLPEPQRLRAGQQLLIRVSPTVDEVVQALAIARRSAGRPSNGAATAVSP